MLTAELAKEYAEKATEIAEQNSKDEMQEIELVKEYAEKVKVEIEKILDPKENISLEIREISKNNDSTYVGIIFRKEDNNIAPTIYVDQYYYNKVDLEDAAEEMVNTYRNSANPNFQFDIDAFMNFDNVKNKIIYRVLNSEKNNMLKEEIPYIQYGDFIIAFYVVVVDDGSSSAHILIRNDMLSMWKVSVIDLYNVAFKNTEEKFPAIITKLEEMIIDMRKKQVHYDMLSDEDKAVLDEEFNSYASADGMRVVTTPTGHYGSYFLASKKVLHEISEELDSKEYYILPSSIHEIIVLPKEEFIKQFIENRGLDESEAGKYLMELVTSVNCTQVAPEEILSDGAYLYNDASEELFHVDEEVNLLSLLPCA